MPNRGPLSTPTFSWTDDSRCAILILRRWYTTDFKKIAAVFNSLFYDELVDRGFFQPNLGQDGIKPGTIKTQLNDMRIEGKNGHEWYKEIMEDWSFPVMLDKFRVLHSEIQSTARNEGIELVEKPRNFESVRGACKGNKRRLSTDSNSSGTPTLVGDLSDEDDELKTSKTKRISEPRPTQRKHTFAGYKDEFPQFCFRAYSSLSAGVNGPEGFLAGAYVHEVEVQQSNIVDYASRHLALPADKTFQSPLISITNSFIWAVLKAKQHRETYGASDASIAIINLPSVRTRTTVWSASEVVTAVQKSGKKSWPNIYRGTFEYFAWQNIPPTAIIRTVTLQELETFLSPPGSIPRFPRYEHVVAGKSLGAARSNLQQLETRELHALAPALGDLIRFLKPDVVLRDPFIGDFATVITQNFGLHENDNIWRDNISLRHALEQAVYGEGIIDTLRMDSLPSSPQEQGLIIPPATPQKARSSQTHVAKVPAIFVTPPKPSKSQRNGGAID